MAFLLHIYPAYQTAKTVADIDSNATNSAAAAHWMTFWMSAYVLEQLPLPSFLVYPGVALLYLPDTTKFVRETIVAPSLSYAPTVTAAFYRYCEKFLPSQNTPAWWQFWKSHTE